MSMKTIKFLIFLMIFFPIFISCKEKEEIDDIKPEINSGFNDAFPLNCDTLYFGESFHFKALFADNAELGTYSVDIHHNFDHHSHSTDVNECNLDEIKEAANPFVFIQDYTITSGSKSFKTDIEIVIPESNTSGFYDEGDYHFFISLTDKEGWSAQKGYSIKILHAVE